MKTDPNPTLEFTPIGTGQRIESLDVLRGLAIFGILFVNASFFAFPMMEAAQPLQDADFKTYGTSNDWFAAWFVKTFFEFKFISLFSMMFGIGAALQFDRARRSGSSFDGFYLRRLLVLLGFGILHAIVFFYGDILTIYALLGVSLLGFCRLKSKILIPLVFALMMIAAFMTTGMALLESLASNTQSASISEQAQVPRTGFDAIQASGFNPQSRTWVDAEVLAHQKGPYLDLMLFRVLAWLMGLITIIISFGWHILAMFALGVVIKRSEFFTPSDSGRRIRKWMMLLLPLGLCLEALNAWTSLTTSSSLSVTIVLSMVREFSTVLTMLGYAAMLVSLVQMGVAALVFEWMAKVGRMALTNYLLETVIMTTIFEFYGLGLFDQVPRIWLLVLAMGVCVILTIFSVSWLSLCSRGPMEWLWRTLAYMRLQSLKRG